MDLYKSIEQIENHFWGEPDKSDTPLVKAIYKTVKKPLRSITIDELQRALVQEVSPEILVPLALVELDKNCLVNSGLYQGDLFIAVLKQSSNFWLKNKSLAVKIRTVSTNVINKFEQINRVRIDEEKALYGAITDDALDSGEKDILDQARAFIVESRV